jgi:predicted HD phosphohydrolase
MDSFYTNNMGLGTDIEDNIFQKEKRITSIIDDIFKFYYKNGNNDYIGEGVTQLEHMTQSAMIAESENQPLEVILAAFFHDLGHILEDYRDLENSTVETMGEFGVKDHEKVGADYLRSKGINYPIPELVENHVKAKRYLTYKYPEYYNNLSDGSKNTLRYQGGPMSEVEASLFENDPLFKTSLKMREYDERSKEQNIQLNNLTYYENLLRRYLNNL